MKKLLFYILIVTLLAGCTKKGDLKTGSEKPKTVTADTIKTDFIDKKNPDYRDSLSDLKIGVDNIPAFIKYTGDIVASASWKDNYGLNYLVITETGRIKVKDEIREGDKVKQEAAYTKEIYSYHYIAKGESAELLWSIRDFIEACSAELTLSYIQNSLTVTDLNNNGVAESNYLYRIGCIKDISPLGLKMVMHEGKEVYAVRGTMIVKLPGVNQYGGEIVGEPKFDNAPRSFIDFANSRWDKYQQEQLK